MTASARPPPTSTCDTLFLSCLICVCVIVSGGAGSVRPGAGEGGDGEAIQVVPQPASASRAWEEHPHGDCLGKVRLHSLHMGMCICIPYSWEVAIAFYSHGEYLVHVPKKGPEGIIMENGVPGSSQAPAGTCFGLPSLQEQVLVYDAQRCAAHVPQQRAPGKLRQPHAAVPGPAVNRAQCFARGAGH